MSIDLHKMKLQTCQVHRMNAHDHICYWLMRNPIPIEQVATSGKPQTRLPLWELVEQVLAWLSHTNVKRKANNEETEKLCLMTNVFGVWTIRKMMLQACQALHSKANYPVRVISSREQIRTWQSKTENDERSKCFMPKYRLTFWGMLES